MKSRYIVLIAIIAVTSCSVLLRTDTEPARLAYVEAVNAYVASDTELADYNIDPVKMGECVVEISELGMRGFSSSLSRVEQLGLYEKWVRIKSGEKVFTDHQRATDFGMKVVGQGAHTNFGTSYQYCIERVAPHSAQGVAESEDIVGKKIEEISKWWDSVIK